MSFLRYSSVLHYVHLKFSTSQCSYGFQKLQYFYECRLLGTVLVLHHPTYLPHYYNQFRPFVHFNSAAVAVLIRGNPSLGLLPLLRKSLAGSEFTP